MKKQRTNSRRSSDRRASRAQRRRAAAAARTHIRKPSKSSVPWQNFTDSCRYHLAAESFLARPDVGAVDPLEALNPAFVKDVGWYRAPGPEPKTAINVTVGMRRPAREFVSGSGRRFVAIDPKTYRGVAVTDTGAHQKFWDHQLNGRPFSMPFLKSGLAIWKKLGIKSTTLTTAYMMQMTRVDAETSDAIQSAIWSTFNTSSYAVDIEALIFALASFMHADPLRKHLVSGEAYVEPYGDGTRYALLDVYDVPGAIDDDREKPIAGNAEIDDATHEADGEPLGPRYLPIEADSALRKKIEADPMIDPDHLGTLDQLKLLLTSDAEKTRVFLGTLDDDGRAILDDLLKVAIGEIEVEHATVVGIVNVMILRMLDIHVAIERQELGRLLR